jgi:hypothetical protein
MLDTRYDLDQALLILNIFHKSKRFKVSYELNIHTGEREIRFK